MSAANRCVHFLPENDIILEIERYEDYYTEQEIHACWYSESELDEVASKRRRAARQWEKDESSSSSSGVYMRGLEHYTKRGGKLSKRTVKRCVNNVMDEQDAQWNKGEDNYERFALVSRIISRFSIGLALLRAEEDEMEARKVYHQGIQKLEVRQSKKPSCSSKSVVSKSTIVDDHTEACSDLSHPDECDSIRSSEDSCQEIESDIECEQVQDQNKKGTESNATFTNKLSNIIPSCKTFKPIWV